MTRFPLPARRHVLVSTWACSLALLLSACGGGGSSTDTASAGDPPAGPAETHTVAVTVTSAISAGETFQFELAGTSQRITLAASGVSFAFVGALASGTAYTVNAVSGPRTCSLSANSTGTIASADVDITADCGAAPAPAAAGLSGTIRGLVGAQVVLQNNGADDLTAAVARTAGQTNAYDETAFRFATAQADGTAYQVTVKTAPAGQTCQVYKGASGNVPVAATALAVGCEITDDLVSRSTGDTVFGTYYNSDTPVVGGSGVAIGTTTKAYGEGRFIAFMSGTAGMGGTTSDRRQIFWRDRLTGQTLLVSASAAGIEGNDDSFSPAISADGLTVVFESYANNLVAGDTNGVRDIFVWNARNPTAGVQRVSVGAGGVQADAESYDATVSGDGSRVAFTTGASNLAAGLAGTNSVNVVVRDLTLGANLLVSSNAAGTGVGGEKPALSEDGNRLAFWSFASDIVAGDNNDLWDIFVCDIASGAKSRVSLADGGGERDGGNESRSRVVAPAISGDGRYVAFATTATNMVAGDTNGAQDVFVVDTQTRAVQRVSVGSSGVQGNADSPVGQGERVAISADGTWVAFSTMTNNLGAGAGTSGISNMLLHNRLTGETRAITNTSSGSVGPASMSRSAAYVVFGTDSAMDLRYPNASGLFAHFTGITRAWWWMD